MYSSNSMKPQLLIDCKAKSLMKLLGKKWTLLILRRVIQSQKSTFTDLKKEVRISQKILSQRIDELCNEALLKKEGEFYIPSKRAIELEQLIFEIEKL